MRAALAVLITALLATSAFSADLKIGYVDLTKVFDKYDKRPILEKQLNDLQDSLTKEDHARVDQMTKMENEMEQLAMGSPERAALSQKLQKAAEDTESFRRDGHERLTQEYVKMLHSMLDDALKVVETMGREGNYDFIIKDQSAAKQTDSQAQAILEITQRVVLFAKPEYDLTQEVTNRLNKQYAASKAEAPMTIQAKPSNDAQK